MHYFNAFRSQFISKIISIGKFYIEENGRFA